MNSISIRNLDSCVLPAVATLLHKLATDFIVPELTPDAGRYFLKENDESSLRARIAQGFVYHVLECDGEIGGFIGMRGHTHVFHLFVDVGRQKRGFARALWEHARRAALGDDHEGVFTVNSSNFAVPVYAALGFVPTAPMQSMNGVLFNPMRWTPTVPG
jgi:GNAT superfamily N-acetyltransferase